MRYGIATAGFLLIIALIGFTIYYSEPNGENAIKAVRVSVEDGSVNIKDQNGNHVLSSGEELLTSGEGTAISKVKQPNADGITGATAASAGLIATGTSSADSGTGWVSGYSRTSDGKPLPGTQIIAYSLIEKAYEQYMQKIGNRIVSTQSNTDGYYALEISNIPKVYLHAIPVGDFSEARANIIFESSKSITQNFTHEPAGGVLNGTVIDEETQKAIEGAEVRMIPYPEFDWKKEFYYPNTVSQADGSFRIPKIAAGSYSVECKAKGYQYYTPMYWKNPSEPLANLIFEKDTQKEITVKLKPGGSVVVTVKDPKGKLVENASVNIFPHTNMYVSDARNGLTDSRGQWRTDSIAKGKFMALAEKEGYGLAYSSAMETGTAEQPAQVDMQLKESASIAGRVVSEDGRGVAECMVGYSLLVFDQTMGSNGSSRFINTQTDESGNYKFEDLSAGDYSIEATYFSGDENNRTHQDIGKKTVTLKDGEQKTGVDFIYKKTETEEHNEVVRGKVIDQNENPIEGVHVYIGINDNSIPRDTPGKSASTNTNAAGEFELTGLLKRAEFFLSTSKEGYTAIPNPALYYPMDGKPVTLKMISGGKIDGVVLAKDSQQPLANVQIILKFLNQFNQQKITQSGGDGTFHFDQLESGSYKITAYAENKPPAESEMITVNPGETTNAAVQIDAGKTFTGLLVAPNGQPVPGVAVALLSNRPFNYRSFNRKKTMDEYPNTVYSGNDGVFKIQVQSDQTDSLIIHPQQWAGRLFPIDPQQVSEAPVTIPLAPGGTVEGTVRDETGKPKTNAYMEVFDEPDFLFSLNTLTDENGQYRIEHVPAGYRIVMDYGLGNNNQQQIKPANVQDGVVTQVDFGTGGATIHGTILKGSQPAAGASIKIEGMGGLRFQSYAVSEENGQYQLTGVPAGQLQIIFTTKSEDRELTPYSAEGYRQFTLADGQEDYPLDLAVLTKEVEGRVIDADTGEAIPWVQIRADKPIDQSEEFDEYPQPTKSVKDGSFKLSLRVPGQFTMEASKEGYTNQLFNIVYDAQSSNDPNPISVEVRIKKTGTTIEAHVFYNNQPVSSLVYANGAQPPFALYNVKPVDGQPGVYTISGFPPGRVELRINSQVGDYEALAITDPVDIPENQSISIRADLQQIVYYILNFQPPDGVALPVSQSAYHYELLDLPRYSNGPWGGVGNGSSSNFAAPIPKGPHRVRFTVDGFKPVECVPEEIAIIRSLPSWYELRLPLTPK